MTQAAHSATREPTMEEILASIRRIIEDGNPPLTKDDDEADVEEVLEFQREFGENAIAESLQHAGAMTALDEKFGQMTTPPVNEAMMHAHYPAASSAPKAAAGQNLEMRGEPLAAEPMFEDTVVKAEETPMAAVEHVELHEEELAAPAPVKESPFERQLRPILSDMAGRQVSAAFSDLTLALEKERQQSLAAIAEDMIRPMLQEWLDNNLPTMVERLVREEIERVSMSGRR